MFIFLGFFYYVLGNLSPRLRSSLKAIQLLAVTKCSVVNKYGSNVILHSFMEDIKVLEKVYFYEIHVYIVLYLFYFRSLKDGINIQKDGETYTFRGTLTLASGDNLASHYLGGFKSPSGAFRKCRQCMGTEDEIKTKVSNIIILLVYYFCYL